MKQLAWIIVLLGLLTACQTPPPAGTSRSQPVSTKTAVEQAMAPEMFADPPINLPPASPFTLNVGDDLEIKFPDFPRYDIAVRVRPDGKISMPLIGAVTVAGRTPDEVQDEIARRHIELGGNAGTKEYLIAPGDELDIKFPYQPSFSESLTVRPDGRIQLMLVGTVQAEGLTPEALQQELRRRYAQHLKVPELAVILRSSVSTNFRLPDGRYGRNEAAQLRPMLIVRSFSLPQVFVGGEVAKPGVFSYRSGLTLMQAIVEAGGERKSAELQSAIVLRKGRDQTPLVIRRDLRADIYSAATNDIYLEPADVVILPKSSIASLGEALELYVFNLFPFIKNSSLGWTYQTGVMKTIIQ